MSLLKQLGYKPNENRYQEGDAVRKAQAMLEQQMAQKPGAYQSGWQTQLDDTMKKIMNREKFSYDLNGDALYNQYKNQYVRQGQQAMEDTIGQMATLTGGYGNSWAQTAGQQAYNGHLQHLNDRIPELYQLAMSKYQMEGDDLYDQAALMAQRENQDYGRYRDQVSDYNAELGMLMDRYDTERNFDYGKHIDDRNFQYQQGRDKVSDEQWQKEFDEAKRRYDQEWDRKYGKGSGGAGVTGGVGNLTDTGDMDIPVYKDYTAQEIKQLQAAAGLTATGVWNQQTQMAYDRGFRPDSDIVGGQQNPSYHTIAAELKGMMDSGMKQSEANNYLSEAYKAGVLSMDEYQKLKQGVIPVGRT